MTDSRLIDFIKDSLKQGVSIEQIKKDLLSVGWKTDLIEQAFSEVQSKNQEEIDEFSIHENLDEAEALKLKASQPVETTQEKNETENITENDESIENKEIVLDEIKESKESENENNSDEQTEIDSDEENSVSDENNFSSSSESQQDEQVIEQAVDAGKSLEQRSQAKLDLPKEVVVPQHEQSIEQVKFETPFKKPISKNLLAGIVAIIVLIILIAVFWFVVLPLLNK